MSRRALFILLITCGMVAASAHVVWADDPSSPGSGKSIYEQIGCDLTNVSGDQVSVDNPCQVRDFVNLFIYLMKWGLSILSILAVLMFVYGGFQFLTAAGRASKVDEGRRVIIGTVVGVIVSLSAYVIINFTVSAISGYRVVSSNPFGVIAAVFGNVNPNNKIIGQTLPRAFSGNQPSQKGSTVVRECRKEDNGWDRDCSSPFQAHCADPGTADGGAIFNYQKKLIEKGCTCGGDADGCYGKGTVACVREFQIANRLPASGAIDSKTGELILNGGSKRCGDNGSADVTAQLPNTLLSSSSTTDKGCCVVNRGTTPLYCLDQISQRGCDALGTSNTFKTGYCATVSASVCGYCSNRATPSSTDPASKCFQLASPTWCREIGQNDLASPPIPNLYFMSGQCDGPCSTCVKSLLITPAAP